MTSVLKAALLSLSLIFIVPPVQAEAASCSQVKKKYESLRELAVPRDSVEVKKIVDVYKILLQNSKCFPKKQVIEFKKIVKEVASSKECSDQETLDSLDNLLGDKAYTKYCTGFKGLVRYTK